MLDDHPLLRLYPGEEKRRVEKDEDKTEEHSRRTKEFRIAVSLVTGNPARVMLTWITVRRMVTGGRVGSSRRVAGATRIPHLVQGGRTLLKAVRLQKQYKFINPSHFSRMGRLSSFHIEVILSFISYFFYFLFSYFPVVA